MGSELRDVALDSVAAWRLTRLVTTDRISEPLRDRLIGHPRLGFIGEGIECDWCVGVWMGAVVAAAGRYTPRLWKFGRYALVVAGAVGLISEAMRGNDEHDNHFDHAFSFQTE
jgi:hypothetical protein